MSSIKVEELVGAIIEAYEVGLDEGSLKALSSLEDVRELAEQEYQYGEGPHTSPVGETRDAPDPDVFFLDNLGDRVLQIEKTLAENGLTGLYFAGYPCGPACPCKGH